MEKENWRIFKDFTTQSHKIGDNKKITTNVLQSFGVFVESLGIIKSVILVISTIQLLYKFFKKLVN